MGSILHDIDDLKADYDKLGTCLGVRDPDIKAIRLQHQDPWLCLKSVIMNWLNQNTTTREKPNRRILVDAVKKVSPGLGDKLKEKYERGLFTTY